MADEITKADIDHPLRTDREEQGVSNAHYRAMTLDTVGLCKMNWPKEKYRGALEFNVLKYTMRYETKNGLDDLKKARVYLTWLIEDVIERGL